jgi:zinc transport system substrate-binding protein
MKRAGIAVFALMLMLGLMGCRSGGPNFDGSGDKLIVCTSFYPMYDFARKVGGDRIELHNLVPAGTEPHDWEPTASDMTLLAKADVFVYNGAGMEHWVDKVLSALNNDALVVVEASKGIDLLSGRSEGDNLRVPQYDPHVWLNPMYAKREMEQIRDGFIQVDPAHRADYEANCAKYGVEFNALDQEFRDGLTPLANKDIIVAHQAFGYLCAAYGLNQVAIEGLSADSEPDPARMAEIIAFARERQARTIFFEELVNPKVAQTIADAIGAQTAVLNPLEGLNEEQTADGEDYFSVMRQNLQALLMALQ